MLLSVFLDALVYLSVIVVLFQVVSLTVGGAYVLALCFYIQLIVPPFKKFLISLPSNPRRLRHLQLINASTGIALASYGFFLLTNQSVSSSSILSILTNPIFLMVTMAAILGIASQLAVNLHAAQQMANASIILPYFTVIPPVVILWTFGDRGLTGIPYVAMAGILLGLAEGVFGVWKIGGRRVTEFALDSRDDQALERIKPLENYANFLHHIPAMINERREINALVEIRRDGYRLLREGKYSEAERKYNVFDFEYERINANAKRDLSSRLGPELASQVRQLSDRLTKIIDKLGDAKKRSTVQKLLIELDELQDVMKKKDFDLGEIHKNYIDEIEPILKKVENVERLMRGRYHEEIAEREGLNKSARQTLIRVADFLGMSSDHLRDAEKVFEEELGLLDARMSDQDYDLATSASRAADAAASLREATTKLRAEIEARYQWFEPLEAVHLLAPRQCKAKEQVECFMLVDDGNAENKNHEFLFSFSGIGMSFEHPEMNLSLNDEVCVQDVNNIESAGKTRNKLRVVVSKDREEPVTLNHTIEVYSTNGQIVQESGGVATLITGVTAAVAIILGGSAELVAASSGATGAAVFLYRYVEARINRSQLLRRAG